MNKVGEILREERKRQNLSINDIESKTRIRNKYLLAIEKSDWEIFPSKTYILGVIKSYGSLLKLDEEKLVAFFRREYEQADNQKFKKKITSKQLTPSSSKIIRIGIIAFIMLFASYFGYQVINLITPPKLEIIAPKNDYLPPRTEKFELIGIAEKDAIVEVNRQRYLLDEENKFSIKIPIKDKQAKVTIKIIGANGKETSVTRIFKVL